LKFKDVNLLIRRMEMKIITLSTIALFMCTAPIYADGHMMDGHHMKGHHMDGHHKMHGDCGCKKKTCCKKPAKKTCCKKKSCGCTGVLDPITGVVYFATDTVGSLFSGLSGRCCD
jgi:hypothetical protein